MSITVDTSTPAGVVAGTSVNFTSVPANSLIMLGYANADSTGATSISSITDNSPGGPLAWTKRAFQSRFAVITAEIWVAPCPSAQASMTGTLTLAGTAPSANGFIAPIVFDGAASSQTGAIVQNIGGTGAITGNLTTTAANSWVFGMYCTQTTAPTPGTSQTNTFNSQSMIGAPGGDNCWLQATNVPTTSSGTVVTLNDTAPNGSTGWVGVMVEILAASGGGGNPAIVPQIIGPRSAYFRHGNYSRKRPGDLWLPEHIR